MVFNELQPYLFWILAGLTGGSALMVVVTQNIVRAATWLLFALGGTAGVFFLLGADFVGAVQLLVYVGGTLVLVIFGVMLTAQGPFITMKTSAAEWALSIVVGISLYAVLALSALFPFERALAERLQETMPPVVREHSPKRNLADRSKPDATEKQMDAATSSYADIMGRSLLGYGAGPAHVVNPREYVEDPKTGKKVEKVERTAYLLPFEIVSVHLLVVLIGAAYLARAKRKRRIIAVGPESSRNVSI
jgi:NADH-quinone oxidoreductase subunit J